MNRNLRGSPKEVLVAFLRLGILAFGGPVAHLGYFRSEFVERRKWLDEKAYGDIVGLCQFLPGPASSQVGFSIGLLRAGILGGLAAWVGFTMPSAVLMLAFAHGIDWLSTPAGQRIVHGLELVAVAVVAQAVWNLGRKLCPDRMRLTIAIVTAALVLSISWAGMQLVCIGLGALSGWLLLRKLDPGTPAGVSLPVHRRVAVAAFALFLALLLGPYALHGVGGQPVAMFGAFYRAGALVFGGGHVVLPLLESAIVQPGWVDGSTFLAGYGLAQALPGPLFTFSAYLGSVLRPAPHGLTGGLIALLAIFLPGILLLIATLPFWTILRSYRSASSALAGVNASVVGLLLAALYRPVWLTTVHAERDFIFALGAFLAIEVWQVAPWIVVVLAAVIAGLLH
jgi:chromate transporter